MNRLCMCAIGAVAALQVQPAVLAGWAVNARRVEFQVRLDSTVVHGGKSSAHVFASQSTSTAFVSIDQTVRADELRGKRVRFLAYVKSSKLMREKESGTGVWLRVDGGGESLAFASTMQYHKMTGTNDWTPLSVVLDVPPDAIAVIFGLTVQGGGDVWIDDASFEVVGKNVAVSGTGHGRRLQNPILAMSQKEKYANAPAAPSNLDFERAR